MGVILDWSHWQTIHDPKALDQYIESGEISGIIHKATQGVSTVRVDPAYTVRKQSFAPRVLWGAYHFGDPGRPVDQAKHFLDVVQPDGKTLLVLDLEAGMTGREAEQFVQTIYDETDGMWPVVYTRASYIQDIFGPHSTILSNCDLWIASYLDKPVLPKQWHDWHLWQFSNGTNGSGPHVVPGVGACDHNRFNGTDEQMKAWWLWVACKPGIEPLPEHQTVSDSIEPEDKIESIES